MESETLITSLVSFVLGGGLLGLLHFIRGRNREKAEVKNINLHGTDSMIDTSIKVMAQADAQIQNALGQRDAALGREATAWAEVERLRAARTQDDENHRAAIKQRDKDFDDLQAQFDALMRQFETVKTELERFRSSHPPTL